MTQEERNLLLKDLCTRLPYGVKLKFNYIITSPAILKGINKDFIECDITACELEDVKPYLFPLSSITEEQEKELNNYLMTDKKIMMRSVKEIDWLYKHHFDVHNLIPYGLAINATNLNIY